MTAMHNSLDPKMQEANPNNKFNGYYQNLTQKTKLMLPTAMWILIVVSVFCGLSLIASLNKTLRSLDKVIEHDEKITDLAVKLLIDDGYDFNRGVDLASQLESKISPVKAAAATQQATTSTPSESDKQLDSNIKDSTKIEQTNKSMFDEMDKSVRNLFDSFTKMTGFGSKVDGDKPQLLPGTPISGSIMISSSIPLENEHPQPNGPAFGNSPFSSFNLPPFIQNLFPSFGRRPLLSSNMMADGGFNEPIEIMTPREEASEVITNFLQPAKPIDGASSDGKQTQKGSLISANIGKLNVNINSPQDDEDDDDDRVDNESNRSENPALSNLESLLNQAFKSDHKHFDNVNSIAYNKEPETLISTSIENPFELPHIFESPSFLGRPSFTKQQTPFIKHGNMLPPIGFPFPTNSKDNQEPIVMMIGTSFDNDDFDKPKDAVTTFFDDDTVKVEPFFKQTNKDIKKLSKQPEPYEFLRSDDILKPKNDNVEFEEKKIIPFKVEEDPILNMMSKVFGFTVNKDKLNQAKENKQDSHIVKVGNNESKDKTESIFSADQSDDIPIFHLGSQTISLPLNTNNDGKVDKKVSSEIEYASKKSEIEKNTVSTTKPQIDNKEFSTSSLLKTESPFFIKSAPQFEAEKPSIVIEETKENEAKVEKDDKKGK